MYGLRQVSRHERLCVYCENEVEDEFHFILKCPKYSILRRQYIKPFYFIHTFAFKLLQLLSTQNFKELINLGKFLILVSDIRFCDTRMQYYILIIVYYIKQVLPPIVICMHL